MALALPDLPAFDPDSDPASTPQRWKTYLKSIETALVAWDIKDDDRRHAVLIHRGSEKIAIIEEQLTYQKTEGTKFKNLAKALTDYFEPKKNITFSTYQFCEMKQEENEGIDAYVTRLKTQAALCDFSDTDRRVKDQIVFGCSSSKLRRKALEDDLGLAALIKAARAVETAIRQSTEMEKKPSQKTQDSDAFRIRREPGKYSSKVSHPSPNNKPSFRKPQ